MILKHPFGDFVPKNARYLIVGSFPGKEVFLYIKDNPYDWYYGTKRNTFWPIIEEVYGIELSNKEDKIKLFTRLRIAITDTIYSCERLLNSNLDVNLTNIVYNNQEIARILDNNKIEKIFFSSRFVENNYKRHFKDLIIKYPNIELITLPSPSPRYAAMTKDEKIKKYSELLPRLL